MAAMGGAEGMDGMGGMGGMPGMGGMGAGRSPEDHKKEVEALKAVSSPALTPSLCGACSCSVLDIYAGRREQWPNNHGNRQPNTPHRSPSNLLDTP